MDRHICIHGHFYQPPRENPWIEEIELQDSAYPYITSFAHFLTSYGGKCGEEIEETLYFWLRNKYFALLQ